MPLGQNSDGWASHVTLGSVLALYHVEPVPQTQDMTLEGNHHLCLLSHLDSRGVEIKSGC